MKKDLALIMGSIAILGLTSVVAGQATRAVATDTVKHVIKKLKPDPQTLAGLEKAKAEHTAAMKAELTEILKRVNQLPDSSRLDTLANAIQNMQAWRAYKAGQYAKKPMDSTAAQKKHDAEPLKNDSGIPAEKNKMTPKQNGKP